MPFKIIATGGLTEGGAYFIDTWGFGTSFFTTKAIRLPKNWSNLLKKYGGWETPIIEQVGNSTAEDSPNFL